MMFVVKDIGVPAGQYLAAFVGVEDTVHPQYGAGIRFQFKIKSGQYAERRVSRVTSPTPTLANSAGRMLAALAGRPLQVNEALDVGSFIGKDYIVTIEQALNGGTRVGDLFLSNSV